MEHQTEEGLNIWRLVGSSILAGLTCVLYFGFVITLFAGFTADIQRDSLVRELGVSTPGMLERLVLQAFHEAALREDADTLRDDIRALDTRSLEETRNGLTLRKEAIAAWWETFEQFSQLGATVVKNRPTIDAEFADAFLQVLNAAHQFVASQDSETPMNRPLSPSPDAGGAGDTPSDRSASVMLDVPFGENDADQKRRADGIEIMAKFNALLDNPKFADAASEALKDQVGQKVEAIRSAMMRFEEKNVRAQIEWANIRTQGQHTEKVRSDLQNELDAVQAEITRQDDPMGQELLSLVALFQHPVGQILSYLIQLPTIMLTLLVTVAAGGLGSVVAFTRQNFGHIAAEKPLPDGSLTDDQVVDVDMPGGSAGDLPNTAHEHTLPQLQGWVQLSQSLSPAARLLVMTGEGIAAAMAIFLCTEAGVLMVSQGGSDGSGQIDISPYLVTFMAFVSGFMAEDAFNRIQLAGKKLFRGGQTD
jgi:hypothetical protein